MKDNTHLFAAPPEGWPSTCVEWAGKRGPKGYGVTLHEGRTIGAHRLSYVVANNTTVKALKGLVVRHTCDNPGCVNPNHLLLGTYVDNARDMISRGRHLHGEMLATAKLNAAAVRAIKLALQNPRRGLVPRLAAEHGVATATIYQIKRGQTWRHIA